MSKARKAERAETGETWQGAELRKAKERHEAVLAGRAASRARQKEWKICGGRGNCGEFYTKVLRCPNCTSYNFNIMSLQPPPPPGAEDDRSPKKYAAEL